ncbi:hypothetical protein MPS_3581 [Mycobacterium pseudoshottsii JCM 15466]|uniref:Uncharacterized protein n=1 Tax=Mycobacterium ulcerans str. Harvey TaxID=1299332 RepID=A0ABP3AHJ4_MYCUL|nr:hypothetical protein MMSP_4685 [Mycobacterium sp. 012931]EPQ70537.1 hypothetical protein MMEU_4976 [Mycobacterium marinum str. Europe]EPQ73326.1 hypothetical protein MMMB2_4098 [Mycobacterium marinum MB2]EUA89532.1 hypothetical protein I551_4051 [Mycobacterium ulcerans str. Harvey]GAQ37208.1 hypothetical protein MPS_3581 [Mycobacterium pseudoshottsii JCM 15466]
MAARAKPIQFAALPHDDVMEVGRPAGAPVRRRIAKNEQ